MSEKDVLWILDRTDERPLPEIVIENLRGTLTYIETPEGRVYSVRDWVYYLSASKNKNLSAPWSDLKKSIMRHSDFKVSEILRVLEIETLGGKQAMDFTDENGLYLITQRMTDKSSTVRIVKKYLADAGVFADDVRREPESIVLSGAINPDTAIDAAINAYRAQGKDDRWIQARIEGKIKRHMFTAALNAAVADILTRRHYATATDDIYRGLWNRTAAYLKQELELPKSASLCDHQPRLALHYQGIAEEVAANKLGQRSELLWEEARLIVKNVAVFIGKQARDTSLLLGMDIATGKALLENGEDTKSIFFDG